MNQFDMKPAGQRILEKDVETYLVKQCVRQGWMCEKFTSPNKRSVPDRLITLELGRMIFVELKRPGGKPTELQTRDHDRRRAMGCEVVVLDSKEAIDLFMIDILS